MSIPEIQDELLRSEYPFLLPDRDPDIERYYYLRNNGFAREAMGIFQTRLKVRYPDDEFRTLLMRSYRSRAPAFKTLLSKAYRALGERSLERVRRIIVYIADKADNYNPRDVYSTIKTAEDILVFVPGDRYDAIAGIERYLRYATVLGIRERSMNTATELIRSYMNKSLSVVEEERQRRLDSQLRAMRRERERLAKADRDSWLRQRKDGSRGKPLIDLSSVNFSPEDLARIEIPRTFVKVEDQTLAYCVKYWNLIEDTAFERILFLYSRKYGTKNYDILMTIRRGRHGKKRDDEILASIMSSLVMGYYYSIRGDRYLQQRWNALKESLKHSANMASRPPAGPAPRPAAFRSGPGAKPSSPKAEGEAPGQAGRKPAQPGKLRPEPIRPATPPEPVKAAASKPVPPKPAPAAASPKPAPAKTAPAAASPKSAPAKTAPPKPPPAEPPPLQSGAAPRQEPAPLSVAPRQTPAALTGKPGGSVSDRLRKLSGRSYDVYQDRFLAKARPAIRKVLGAGRGLFFNLPEKAEDLIFNFLKGHYSDPYMNWEESGEKTELQDMGFEVESLDPIIDECFKKL